MAEDLIITLLIVGLAWWHRDPWAYVIAGFSLIFFGLHFAGAIADITTLQSVFLVALGVYSFFKAAWDRPKKK